MKAFAVMVKASFYEKREGSTNLKILWGMVDFAFSISWEMEVVIFLTSSIY